VRTGNNINNAGSEALEAKITTLESEVAYLKQLLIEKERYIGLLERK